MNAAEKERLRVLKACEGCKVSRRKCNGMSPCEYCQKRNIECLYDTTEMKKRGPKKGSRKSKLQVENERLKAELRKLQTGPGGASTSDEEAVSAASVLHAATAPEVVAHKPKSVTPKASNNTQAAAKHRTKTEESNDTLKAAAAILDLSNHPDPKTLLQSTVWQLPGPIVPIAEEETLLRTFFEYANKLLPVVDENYFYAALEEAQYYPEPEQPSKPEKEPMTIFPTSLSVKPYENPLNTVLRNSEVFGFRVCYYTLLCVGAKVQGNFALAKRYYELARAFIGPCFNQPSQHLVSALLLMTMITRSLCADTQQAALHAVLAQKMAEIVDVGPDIRMIARMFSTAHSHATGNDWPPLASPPGLTAHQRLADIMAFALHQLVSDFPAIQSQQEVTAMTTLMDEAYALHKTHGILKDFPAKTFSLGISALLYSRFNKVVLALEKARECIELAVANKLARFCFPVVFAIAKLMPVLKEIMHMPEFGPATADKTKELSVSACSFLKESKQTIGACPKLAEASLQACKASYGAGYASTIAPSSGLDMCSSDESSQSPCGAHPAAGAGVPQPQLVHQASQGQVRPSEDYERKRKLPPGASDELRGLAGSSSSSRGASDYSFVPTAMMRMSAAIAPRASDLHQTSAPTVGLENLGDVSSQAIIPGLLDDGSSVSPSVRSRTLGALADPLRAFSPAPSLSGLSMPPDFARPGERLAGGGKFPPPLRMTSFEFSHSQAYPSDLADLPVSYDLEILAQRAYGDCVLSELDREARQAGSVPLSKSKGPIPSKEDDDDDDRGSVTSLGLRLRSTVDGLMAGMPMDLSALETY